MRTSTAYFAGAGTVVAAIVAGVSGGLLMGDVISPKSVKQGTELTRLERRMSPEPVAASVAPSEPVPYLATPQTDRVRRTRRAGSSRIDRGADGNGQFESTHAPPADACSRAACRSGLTTRGCGGTACGA